MEPAKLHLSRREKSRKFAKYLQLEEKSKKLQKKPHLLGEERFGYAEIGSSNKPRHSSDSRDRSQPRRGRSGGENLTSYSRSREGIADMQRSSKRIKRKPLPRDSSDEDGWEHLDSKIAVERIVSGRIINQYTPPESDSGLDSRRLGPRFTHVDVNLEKGMGDEPLPHAVPIVGLRSARTARSTNSNSAANSSRPYSVGSAHRSTNTGASAKASSRSLSTGSVRDSSHLPTSRSRIVSSTRLISAARSRFSSESTDETISPRTYHILSPAGGGAKILPKDKSSRTARSTRSMANLLSNDVSPRSGREHGQPPGFWVNISEERKSNSSNLCVWAITDPPQLPPGIAWEKVIPPTSPVPSPKELAVEAEIPEVDDEGKENEPHDIALDTSIHIIPELTPSLDPSVVVPKTIIRKVMVLPDNVGYPGFCEPTETELKQKSKKISSKEIMGDNKSAVSKHKDQLKSKKRPNSRKEQPQKAGAHVHKVSKKNGITPSSWKAGLKCVRKELGPWKTRVSSDEGRSSGNQENSEVYEKLNDICKFVEMTENKISEYKSSKTRPDSGSSEVHLFHRGSGESKKLEMEQCGESIQNKELNDLVDEPKSLDIQQVTRDDSSEKKSEIMCKKSSEGSLILNDLLKADNSSRNSPIIHQRRTIRRRTGVKSAHNLNNAFIADNCAVLPKRANSQFNLPSDSKEVSQSKCALRHYDPMAIKEYIRIQKKQRHVKLLEEKEKKKLQEEYRRAKLQELRSKSKELVEESLKKKPKSVNMELEFLQMYGKQLDELASNVNLKEKSLDVQPVRNNYVSTEKKSSSQCDSTHSNVTTHRIQNSNSQNSLRVKMPEKLDIHLPTDFKLDCASIHPAEEGVPKKSVQHVALQTDEDLFKSLLDSKKKAVFGDNSNIACSSAPTLQIVESILPICEAKVGETAASLSEKSGSSKSDSDKIVIDKELCHSIHREMKKLSHNVYVLEKRRMIGVFQEKGAIPSTSAHGRVLTRKSLEVGDLRISDLNNKKNSSLGSERLSIIRNDSPSEVVFPVQSHANPLCSSLMPHSILELPARAKPSVNNFISENQIGCNLLDDADVSINMQKLMLTGKERKSPPKNNISSNLLDIKHNYTSVSDSIISEGSLSEDELANLARLKEPVTNNLHENAQCKNLDEKKEDEIPLWLKKPPMESHPFNFISAVKMKLKRFLEEQNKNILTDISSNAIQIPRPLDMHDDDKKEGLGKEHDVVGDEQEVNYESDFEPSVASGSGPSQNDEKVSAANSSDLDTATEDILPTDEVPESKAPFPNDDARKEVVDYISDNISELSRKSGSLASNQSHFSNVNHQLMAPNFTLSRLGGDLVRINDKDTESKASTAELKNVKEIPTSNQSEVLSVLSLPSTKLSCKSDKSSYGSCKTDLSIASKSGLISRDVSSNKSDSRNKILPPTVTQRKTLGEESTLGFNEVISSVSTMQLDKFLSDGSHISSKDALSHNATSNEIESASKVGINYDGRFESAPPSSFPHQLSGLKELNDNHSQRLAEMEMKAFEHRLEMERAFEKERQKLELALEEAKKTVIDSKLEATKFISNAAVELVKSQAEATKANAEATRHISEAKVIDALKLETISAQSASAAAFAAVQAAIKQLQSFKKVKQLPKKNSVPENSFTSTASEAGSSTSEGKSVNTSAEGGSELSALAKGTAEEPKLIEKFRTSAAKTAEKSIKKTENKDDKIVDAFPEESSLNSISENISEPEYSSKFDETASEGELKSAPKPSEGGAGDFRSYSASTKMAIENKKVSTNTKSKKEFGIRNLDTSNETEISLGSSQLNEDSSNTDHDSFTKFSLSMFQQLMREEEMRAQHQQALLKLREEALIDKTKAEMTLLELKKKQYREKGQEDAVSSIRKKQRGLLLRLKLERDEILRLKKSHKTASHERRMMLTQQQHIVRMRISTKEIMNKLHTKKLPPTPKAIRAMGFIGSVPSTSKSNLELNTEESALESGSHCSAVPEEIHSVNVTHSDVSLPTVPAHSSHASLSDSGSHNGQKKNMRRLEKQVVHRLDDLERNKRFLSEREKNLIHRRQAVEELIVWRKRLEQEEERIRALESQALAPSKVQQVIGTKELSASKADRSTSPLQFGPPMDEKPKEDAATSMADISLTHSSILEDVPNESQKSSFSVVDEIDGNSKQNDFGDESLKSSASASVIKTEVSAAEQSRDSDIGTNKEEVDSKSSKTSIPPLNDKNESKDSSYNITIKSPLTSYVPGRQKRRHSSGSDESVILSQNETASEQSDVEGKICALQEQLRRRKMEAELLKREQKRCRRERLKAKEQSLIKQIQAYDQYIHKARLELEQECESPTTSLVKPQIKQPRVAEWKKVIDETRDILLEASEKATVTESGINENTPLESHNEEHKQSEKLSPLESIPESAVKGAFLSLEQEYSEVACEPCQLKNESCSSLSEVLEEIQMPTEELPVSDNSQGSISRESSVETTIESPTKQDVVESARDSDGGNDKQADILSKPDEDGSLGNDMVQNDSVSTIIEAKSDHYDEDTFEPTSGSNMKVDEFSMKKLSGSMKSPEGHESNEIIEELPSESHERLPSRVSGCENESDKMKNEENSIASDHFVEEIQTEHGVEEVYEDSVSLPSCMFEEHSAAQFNANETFVIAEDNVQSTEKAEQITENILRNLLDESVVEAEILINKNSACTLTIQEFDDKVKELVPLHEVESYEEVLEQNLEEFHPENEEMVNIVIVSSKDVEEVYAEDIEANDVDTVKANAVLSDLLQLLLEDATAEIFCIMERRESFFRQERNHDVMVLNECTFQSTTSISRDSDVIKRVQQIMLESSLSQVSPREKSRPQDLMITTYDVLSPDSSNCSSPVLGQPNMEMVFIQEEKYSPKSPVKYTSGKAIQFLQVEHSGGLGASAAGGESSGAENDAFPQEWFEEDFGLNSTLREVEEIQLQRLQIEREIEQLQLAQAKEQQQKQYPYNFYIREIPNKPPPPYTPPEETPRISASFAGPISPLGTARDSSPKAAIPTDQNEIAKFVRTTAGKFYDAWSLGEKLDTVIPPSCSTLVGEVEDSYQNDGSVDGDLKRKSRRGYSQFLFHLIRQLADELLDNVEGEKFVSVPTRFGSKKWRPSLPLPSRECFMEEVKKQALVILGFIPRETRDNFMFSWTVKKRDHIEEIIMREIQEEERFWTNFDEEERYIKEQIAESLFELLLVDTTKAVAMAYERRVETLSVNE